MYISVNNQDPDENGAIAVIKLDPDAAHALIKKLNNQPLTEDEANVIDDYISEELHYIAVSMDYREASKKPSRRKPSRR
jgi:hypothetical protein